MTADETETGEQPDTNDGPKDSPAQKPPPPPPSPPPPPPPPAPPSAPPSPVQQDGNPAAKPETEQPKQQQPTAPTSADLLKKMAEDLAVAEARKPLEVPFSDVYSSSADKLDARQKLKQAYADAIAPNGPLIAKFNAAKKSFNRAVLDMATAPAGAKSALDAWLDFAFGDPGHIKHLLGRRKELAAKVTMPSGKREQARADAQAETKRWAARYADWSMPVEKITAQIGQYADKIDKLNADINNDVNRMSAMTAFWFEVAPKHLQLAPDLDANVKAAVDKVAARLAEYGDLKHLLTIGSERFAADGSLYLAPDADKAAANRETVLGKWNDKAVAQAQAEAAFKLDPDDLASAKQHYDKLKDDGWIAEAKKFAEPASPPIPA